MTVFKSNLFLRRRMWSIELFVFSLGKQYFVALRDLWIPLFALQESLGTMLHQIWNVGCAATGISQVSRSANVRTRTGSRQTILSTFRLGPSQPVKWWGPLAAGSFSNKKRFKQFKPNTMWNLNLPCTKAWCTVLISGVKLETLWL